jgi:hypothetical protein
MLPVVQILIGDVRRKHRLVEGPEPFLREDVGIDGTTTRDSLQIWYVTGCILVPCGYLEILHGHKIIQSTSYCLVLAYSLIHNIFYSIVHYARCKSAPH